MLKINKNHYINTEYIIEVNVEGGFLRLSLLGAGLIKIPERIRIAKNILKYVESESFSMLPGDEDETFEGPNKPEEPQA